MEPSGRHLFKPLGDVVQGLAEHARRNSRERSDRSSANSNRCSGDIRRASSSFLFMRYSPSRLGRRPLPGPGCNPESLMSTLYRDWSVHYRLYASCLMANRYHPQARKLKG